MGEQVFCPTKVHSFTVLLVHKIMATRMRNIRSLRPFDPDFGQVPVTLSSERTAAGAETDTDRGKGEV